jgi:hypothetical protein
MIQVQASDLDKEYKLKLNFKKKIIIENFRVPTKNKKELIKKK